MSQRIPFTAPEHNFTLSLPAGITLTPQDALPPHIGYYFWSTEHSTFSIYSERTPGQTARAFLDMLLEEADEVHVQRNEVVQQGERQFHLLQAQTTTHVPRSRYYDEGRIEDQPDHYRRETLCYQFWQTPERTIRIGYSYQPEIGASELETLEEILATFRLIAP